jgi:MFS family permease
MSASPPDPVDDLAPVTTGSDGDRARVQRRTLAVVVLAQVLGGAGLAAGITVGALLAQQMLGSDGSAGLPTGLFTLGSAATAYLVGVVSQRAGRRIGLGLGFLAGGLGAFGVVGAAAWNSVPLLFVSLFVYGAGSATNLQARYAGTDLATPATRGTAISIALFATTFGAVAGPNLVEPLSRMADAFGLPPLAGPFLLAGVAYTGTAIVLITLLRPDPLLLARRLESAPRGDGHRVPESSPAAGEPRGYAGVRPGAYVGATIMILTQIAMVAIMTMTPVHMRHHHTGLDDVGMVIGFHIAAMYLPSPVTGVLVDRVGRTAMAIASAVVLLAAGVTGAAVPGDSLALTIVALVLLGLGWNFGLITGTALVVDSTDPANRPRVQGNIDVLVALAGATGGVLSGLVVAASSYAALALGGGLLSLALIPALVWSVPARNAAA